MKNIPSDLQSLIEQANSDQSAVDDAFDQRLADQQQFQELEKIVHGVRCFTPTEMEAELGREPPFEEFCEKWAGMWIACLEVLKSIGIDSVPKYWLGSSVNQSAKYATGLFLLAFAGEREKLAKALFEAGSNRNDIQKNVRWYIHWLFCDLIRDKMPVDDVDEVEPCESPGPFEIEPEAVSSTNNKKASPGRANQKKNVNARMLATIQSDYAARGWNSREWAKHLKCSTAAITKTVTWKELVILRNTLKAEKAQDKRGRYIKKKNQDRLS